MAKKAPVIRFKGFEDDWEQRKLGEVTERVRGNDGRMDLPTLTISAGSGWLDQRERFSGNIAGNEQKNYTLLSKGELSYNHGNSKLAKYGVVYALRNLEKALVPRVYHSFKTTNEAVSDYVEYMFATKRPDRELAKLVSSGARMDGLLNINYDDFMGINIMIPEVDEQNRISKFLRQFDDTITLHQRKVELLQQFKKGFLQKIFPSGKEKIPQIRFANYEGDWEQRKLGEHSQILTGGTPKTQIKEYWEPKEIPWMSSGEINKKRLISTDNQISKLGFESSSARWVKENSVLIALAGQGKTRGTVAINEIPLTTNQSIAAIETDDKLDSEFLFQNLEKRYEELRLASSGDGSRGGLNKRIISDIEIKVPSINEQSQVGSFFKHLDNTIALHQSELEKLEKIKNSFLQKMFI